MIILSHANRLPVTIQYPYEKIITSERFRGRIHFEFDKCIACEVCVHVCPIDLPVVDWKLETDIRKKRLRYIKNDHFERVVRDENSQFFFIYVKVMEKNEYLSRIHLIYLVF